LPPSLADAFRILPRIVLVLGRSESADIRIDHPLVAPQHARLRLIGGRLELTAPNPAHPVFVNDIPIERCQLAVGDVITIGRHSLAVIQPDVLRLAGAPTSAHRLTLRNVTLLRHQRKPFRRTRVRRFGDGLDVDLEAGRLTVLIGPSGEGKTTLCEGILGEIARSSGDIRLDGATLLPRGSDFHERVSFVPQEPAMYVELPLRQALTYVARLRLPPDWSEAERAYRVDAILAQLGLVESANRSIAVRDLSGGQKKRASLAMELLTEPDVLLLDEPTTGLDEGLDFELMDQLRELAAEDRIVVVVSHSLRSIRAEDHVVALGRGGIVAYSGLAGDLATTLLVRDGADLMDRLRAGDWANTEAPPGDAAELAAANGRACLLAPAEVFEAPPPTSRRPMLWRHLPTLAWREFARRRAHPLSLASALVIFPLLTALAGRVLGDVPLDNAHGRDTRMTLLIMPTCLAFFSLSFSFTSIVSDWEVIRREARWGVSGAACVLARFTRATVFATWLAIASMVLYLHLAPGPSEPLISTYASFCLIAWSQSVCFVALGLLVSAAATRLEPVVYWMVVVAAAAVLLNGITLPLDAGFASVLQPLSQAIPTRWSTAAWAVEIQLTSTWSDPLWQAGEASLWWDIGVMGGLTVAFLTVAIILVRRRLRRRA
jgi:ABC-type multidrug transport system ATPase subunit